MKKNKIKGTNKNDTLFGTDGDDHIQGRGGDDRILPGLGNDRIDGGPLGAVALSLVGALADLSQPLDMRGEQFRAHPELEPPAAITEENVEEELVPMPPVVTHSAMDAVA